MSTATTLTFPIGRLLWGSMTQPQTKDGDGRPLVIKTGPDAGKPTQRFAFGVGIRKGQERSWAETPWGAEIAKTGRDGFPQGQWQTPTFSWKVTDGDSTIPNRRGKTPASREGYPGHWVLAFSSAFAPKTVTADGTAPVDPASIKCGHYVQVNGSVGANGSASQPGVYLNHRFVAHSGFGEEIDAGPDPAAVGFGGQLPPGASTVPVTGLPASFGAPAAPPVPEVAPPVVAPPSIPTPAVAPPVAAPPTPVKPHTPFLTPAAPPPSPPAPVMTAKANGATYAQMIAAGWSHAQLIEHGYITQ